MSLEQNDYVEVSPTVAENVDMPKVTTDDKESHLVVHARRELELAGLFDKDSDYAGMMGDAVMELIKTFADQDHSGFSAGMALYLFKKLGSFEALTPLTNNPDEWMDVSEYGGPDSPAVWQNRRQSNCFSNDGGKTYYNLDEENKPLHTSELYTPKN